MQPKGFWSYARGDDAALDQELTALRKQVAEEVSLLLGAEVDMFQDIYDIRSGDDWEKRLRDELTEASFMIPVLTPRYFTRPWCREEVMTYLRLAEERGVPPRLFPIYVVRDQKFDRQEHCEVRAAVARYQYFDWRPLRFEENTKKLGKAVNGFSEDIFTRLEEDTPASSPTPKPAEAPETKAKVELAAPFVPAAKTRKVVAELVVDQWPGNSPDFDTIGAAIKAAKPGSRILIHPGTYQENVVLDKKLELVGVGAPEEVVVRVSSGHAMTVTASMGEVRNMRLERAVGAGNNVGLLVTAGQCRFENCHVTSGSISAVVVSGGGTAPRFSACRFEKSIQSGAIIWGRATPQFDDCVFAGNDLYGVEVKSAADPVFERCRFENNTQDGAFIYENGRGQFSACHFVENGLSGVISLDGGAPMVRGATLAENQHYGIAVADAKSGGTFENCTLRGNMKGAWNIAKGAMVIRRGNVEE